MKLPHLCVWTVWVHFWILETSHMVSVCDPYARGHFFFVRWSIHLVHPYIFEFRQKKKTFSTCWNEFTTNLSDFEPTTNKLTIIKNCKLSTQCKTWYWAYHRSWGCTDLIFASKFRLSNLDKAKRSTFCGQLLKHWKKSIKTDY